MLWIRGALFTLLVPAVVAFVLPRAIDPGARRAGGWFDAGWVLVAAGALMYFQCLLGFLAAGGTPMIYFARALRWIVGEEPEVVVTGGMYRFSRNPMYLGVMLAVFGQAVALGSLRMVVYGCVVFAIFHAVAVWLEEPHLRASRGAAYEDYCRRVPRWLGRPRRLRD